MHLQHLHHYSNVEPHRAQCERGAFIQTPPHAVLSLRLLSFFSVASKLVQRTLTSTNATKGAKRYVATSQTMGQGSTVSARSFACEDASVFMLREGLPLSDIGCRQLLGVSNWTLGASVTLGVQLAVQNTAAWWR